MELAFCTEEVRNLCTVDSCAIAQLGAKTATALRNRLADIRAAEFINDMPVGNPRYVVIDRLACCLIDLEDGYILTVVCNQPNPKTDQYGNVDWSRVRRVKVLSAENS